MKKHLPIAILILALFTSSAEAAYKLNPHTGKLDYYEAASGSGDVTAVGDCTTGDCFSGTSGNILTFADDVRDGTIEYHDDNYFLFRSDGLNDADSTFQPTAVFQPYEANAAGKVIVKNTAGAYPIRLQADGGVGPSLTGQSAGAGVGFIFDTYGGIVPATVADGTDTSSVTVNNNGIDFGGASYRWANVYSVLGNFSGVVTHTADVKLTTAGNGLYVKEGTNATMGVATLVAGTVTVSTTKVTANSRIFLTAQTLGTITVPVGLYVSTRSAGTSFTILSGNLTDTSTVAWMIVEPA